MRTTKDSVKSSPISEEPPTGLRLLPLKQACERRGIAPRTYFADRSLLPLPVQQVGPNGRVSSLLFAEHEVDALIADLLARRAAGDAAG